MDAVLPNQENCVVEKYVLDNTNNEAYAAIPNNVSLLKQETIYHIEEQDSVLSNADYQSALNCLDEFEKKCHSVQKMNYYINDTEESNQVIDKVSQGSVNDVEDGAESENISFKTTDDESMAVEALRQLGGMYSNVVTTEQALPMLACSTCSMKFHTTSDLRAHTSTCKAQAYESYTCSVCNKIFYCKQQYNDHHCIISKIPCKFCYTYFATKIEMDKHIKANHDSDRPYKCNFCPMDFIRSSSLANHSKVHNYLPGREFLRNSHKVVGPDPVNMSTWTFESVYVSEETANNTDPVSNWNLDYVSNPLLQTNYELNTVGREITVTNDLTQQSINEITEKDSNQKLNDDLDFQLPIKVEVVPYETDIENCLDETFPITSLPQMEITIGTDSKKPYVCSDCGMNFSREKALINHFKLHSIGWLSSHECENCGKTFPDENSINFHKKSCGVILNSEEKADDQTENKSTESSNKTTESASKKTESSIKKSESSKKNIESFKPSIKTTIPKKPQVKVGKHSCPECDKQFTTKQKMFRHLWIHRKKTFTCELCGMSFALQAEITKHRLSQHADDSPYGCTACGKCFASRQGLWEHARVHGAGSAGLYTCNTCNKTFTSRQGFLIHHRTHTGERPYGCRFCLKAFRDGGTLRKHERIHTGYRPYICPICSSDFNQKVVLREHVRWVHAANMTENESGMFVCELCNLSVSDREDLCAHIVKHSDYMTIEAKNNLKDLNHANVNIIVRKKNVQPKTKIAVKVENASPKKIIVPKQEQLDLSFEDPNLGLDVFIQDKNNIECDLCGDKFPSQKDLMTHVHIHI